MSSRPARSTELVPGQPGLHKETLSKKKKKIKYSRSTEGEKNAIQEKMLDAFWEKEREDFKQKQKWGSSHLGVLALEVLHFTSSSVGHA